MNDETEIESAGELPPSLMPPPLPATPPPLPVDGPVAQPVHRSGYFISHWRGELPLGISFWLNTALLNLALSGADHLAELLIRDADDPRPYMLAAIVIAVFSELIFVWQAGGVIRSARRFRRETGFRFLAYSAVTLIVIGAIMHVRLAVKLAPLLPTELGWVVMPDQYGNYTVKPSADGHSLNVEGGMGFGLPAELRRALRQNPKIDTVIFDSLGGRSHAGLVIGNMLSEGRYTTRVDHVCASACTIAFLGGTYRLVGVNGRMGFHHPKFVVGVRNADADEAVERERAFVWSRGVSSDFIQKTYDTVFEKIYVPTMDELLKGHVITGIADENGEIISLDDYHARHEH